MLYTNKLIEKVNEVITQTNHLIHTLKKMEEIIPVLVDIILIGEIMIPLEREVDNIKIEINQLTTHIE